jgi:hypothetical protein
LDLDLGEVFKDESKVFVFFIVFTDKKKHLFEYGQPMRDAFLIAVDDGELDIISTTVRFSV